MQDIMLPPKGRLWVSHVDQAKGSWVPATKVTLNTVMYEWGFVAAKTIGHGDPAYRINTMYIEFSNVTDPADAVSVPSFTRDEGLSYYNGLSGSSTNDSLRVPLIGQPTISIESGFESYFTEGVDGNLLTFFAQSAGGTGVHSKTFANGSNSKIFGAALVAAPVNADPTKDIVFSRAYFASADQTVKQTSSQVGITWELPFE